MPIRPLLVQHVMKSTSSLPTDVFVTDWVVGDSVAHSDASLAPDLAAIFRDDFWEHSDGTFAPRSFLSPALSLTVDVKVFDLTGHLSGTPHGSPISVSSFTLDSVSSANPLPEEVAIALSIHGDLTGIPESDGATRPAARRRGRLFLGPWSQDAVAGPIGGHVYVNIPLQNTLVAAASNLLDALFAADLQWHVWSRANAAVYPVVGGWLDNAFDTIRSRGADASGRVLWP